MADARASDLLDRVRELEQLDVDVAARVDAVVAVLGNVDDVRDRSRRVALALEELPGDLVQAERTEQEARSRDEAARTELAEAERALADVGRSRRASDETKVAAERALRRASVAAEDAAAAVTRAHDRVGDLHADDAALRAEADGLAVEAAQLAREVAEVPRLSDSGRSAPGSSLAEIEDWAARAHAALFVVRGGLEREREQIVQEANNVAAAALGEQVAGASVALVRRRLEESL